jgi:serine/threonine protein kinase
MRECPKCELCFNEDVMFCPHDSGETRSVLPGGTLLAGRYLLEKRLGRGAMGQVYLARDENLGTRKVAVKTVRQDFLNSESLQEGEAIARFEREARSAASIRHPNVVDVTDFGKTDEGVFYLVMEYVEGETLHKLLRREGTLTAKRALHLLKQIAAGVEAAHEAGILHRDLKPANIFLMYTKKRPGENSDDGFVKVGDFGLAKIINQTTTDTRSDSEPSSRGIVGTPEFMAPEQMQYEAKLDARADIYALGTIAYLMLGGKTPFSGDLPQLVAQKLMDKPTLLSAIRSDIPFEVEDVVMKALETDPAARPDSVSSWVADLEKAVNSTAEKIDGGTARLVIMAQVGAEVYVDDERRGSVGSSGRLVLSTIPPGQHILRVSMAGSKDDERVIEIREGSSEQVIQANLYRLGTPSQPSPSRGSSAGLSYQSSLPEIVSCVKCNARFAAGVKFCGRCGGGQFVRIGQPAISGSGAAPCQRCGTKLPPFSKFCGRCGFKMTPGASPPRMSPQPLQQPQQPQASQTHQTPRRVEIVCIKCGASYPAGTKFCGRCGITLN